MHSCNFGRELLLGRLEPITGGATGLMVRFVARRTARNAGCYIADGGLVRKKRRGVGTNGRHRAAGGRLVEGSQGRRVEGWGQSAKSIAHSAERLGGAETGTWRAEIQAVEWSTGRDVKWAKRGLKNSRDSRN